jgi:hypothetical protein
MSSDPLLSEALARIEWKLDIVIRNQQMQAMREGQAVPNMPSMQFEGTACPVCNTNVKHIIDIVAGAVRRVCGCGTGKLPPLMISLPIPEPHRGTTDATEPSRDGDAQGGRDRDERAKNRGGGQGR